MPDFLVQFGELSELLRGFVVSVILIPSALTGILAGGIQDRISRKKTISLGCALFSLGSAISAGSTVLGVLVLGRCIAGTGEGLFLSAMVVYVCETSPAHLRGKMVTLLQVTLASGMVVGFFVCYASININNSLSWRSPFIIQAISSFVLALVCQMPWIVYSPRWLMLKGRRDEAEKNLDLIAGTGEANLAERRELLGASLILRKGTFLDIFRSGVRGRTLLGAFLNVFQQLSGIDFVLYYATLLFTQAGLSSQSASFFAGGVTALGLVFATVLGAFYIDQVGRRRLFLIGGVLIAFCHCWIGILYYTGLAQTPAGKFIVIGLIEIFAMSFSGTWALCVRLYATEIQPGHTRAMASAFGQGANQLVNFLVALTGPAFLARSNSGPYFTYASFSLFATVVAWVYMKETIGKSLETIDTSFDGSAFAVKWPFQSRITHMTSQVRIRRSSRAGSNSLAGETKAEFRSNLIALE